MVVGVPGSWRALNDNARYTPNRVEELLPAVWGIEVGERPEHVQVCRIHGKEDDCISPSMRHATPGPESDILAEIADIQRAWAKASYLSPEIRRALELACRYGATHQEIADATGVSRATITTRIQLGLHQLSEWLNGEHNARRGFSA